jgi:post-segregation antitoxin (ccd killing protein)
MAFSNGFRGHSFATAEDHPERMLFDGRDDPKRSFSIGDGGMSLVASNSGRDLDKLILSMTCAHSGCALETRMTTGKAVSLTMENGLLARAKAEGINLSAELEQGIRAKIANIEIKRWKRENADAIASYERRVTEEGTARGEYRRYG